LDDASSVGLSFSTDQTSSDRSKSEEYGVAVRAGAVTPQIEDEEKFRSELDLPEMSDDAKRAWKEDKGIRRPITLRDPNDKSSNPFDGDATETDEDTDTTEEGRQMRLVK
jgi:hypothetical protein